MWNKIILAPDSFKGTMCAAEVSETLRAVIARRLPEAEVVCLPVADGGEGTVDAYLMGKGGERICVKTLDALERPTLAEYALLPDGSAVIELAAASGLPQVEDVKDPMRASSYGTGLLLRDALNRGVCDIVLGLGGSAVVDGAMGILAALGIRFLDDEGKEIAPSGEGMGCVAKVDASGCLPAARRMRLRIACDVDNPLAGKNGAAYVYAPQKGASPEQVKRLDQNLLHYHDALYQISGVDRRQTPGMGAAGGICLGLSTFFDVEMVPGAELILRTVEFDRRIEGADVVITGEGRIDGQSVQGKVPVVVARHAREKGVPTIVIAGDVAPDAQALQNEGIRAIFSTNRQAVPFEQAKKSCRQDLAQTMENILSLMELCCQKA